MRFIAFLFLVECLFVGRDIFQNQIASDNLIGMNLSILDLVILFGLFSIILISCLLLFWQPFLLNADQVIDKILEDDRWLLVISVLAGLLVYESLQDILFLQADLAPIHYLVYRSLLSGYIPVIGLVFVSGIQFIVVIVVYRWQIFRSGITKIVRKKSFIIFVLLAVVVIGSSFSGIGNLFTSDLDYGFYEMGVPILGIQVGLLGMIALVVLIAIDQLKDKWIWLEKNKIDWLIMIIIALVAYSAWISVPFGASSFTDIQRPPNQEFYPISDALHYEQAAHQILVGNGMKNYSHVGFQAYLAVLHFLAGDSLKDIYPIHLAVICLVPLLLFKLTSTLHNRLSGILVSMLYIIKTRNALFLSEHITLSSVADAMTEPLATVAVLLAVTSLVVWLKKGSKGYLLPLIAGAGVGWGILIRVEVIVLLPVFAIIMLLYFWKDPGVLFRSGLTILIGFVLLVGPWVTYLSFTKGTAPDIMMGRGFYISRSLPSNEEDQKNEDQKNEETPNSHITGNYPHHLANNLFQLVFYLPSNHQPLLTIGSLPDIFSRQDQVVDMEGDSFSESYLERYVRSLPYWWDREWAGNLEPRSILPVLGSILLISIGLAQFSGERIRLAALLGLIVLLHSIAYAFIGWSGGRTLQIIDWIPLVFYGMGLSMIIGWVLGLFHSDLTYVWGTETSPPNISRRSNLWMFPVSLFLLCIGIGHPLMDAIIPPKYTQDTEQTLLAQIEKSHDRAFGFSSLLEYENGLDVYYGKVLYPRYFNSGERMDDNRGGAIPDFSYSRVEFYLVGEVNSWATIPLDKPIGYLPHGAEVVILGTPEGVEVDETGTQISGDYIKSALIVVIDENYQVLEIIFCSGVKCNNTKNNLEGLY